MDYLQIKKLLNEYLEKNHPEIDFYKDKEHDELFAIYGINYKYHVKAKPFCIYEKYIKIEREKYCKANPYNPNWLDENEEEEDTVDTGKEASNNGNDTVKDNDKGDNNGDDLNNTSNDTSNNDIDNDRKMPRKRRIVKENMFNEGKSIKIYKCELQGCNRQYTSSFGLKYHMKEGHSEEKLNVYKPFVCPMTHCGRKYKNNNGLKYHLKNYHDIE